MSRFNEVRDIYDKITDIVTGSREEWKEFLSFASRIYKYNFDNAILIYAQRPDATMVANMELWNKKVGRYVNKGTKSIAVFDTSKLNLKLEYLFDIKDTNGDPHTIPKLWRLNDETTPILTEKLKEKYELNHDDLDSIISQIVEIKVNANFEECFKDFESDTKSTWLKDLPIEGLMAYFTQTIIESTQYMVAKRCGIDSPILNDENAFRVITHFNTLPLTFRLGNAVCGISQGILREIESEVIQIIKEKRSERNNERSTRVELQRDRRDTLSRDSSFQGQGSRPEATREVRTDGTELSEGESSKPIQLTFGHREVNANDAQNKSGGLSEARTNHGTDSKEKSDKESREHSGKPQVQGTGEADSRRDSAAGDSVPGKIEKKIQTNFIESLEGGSFFMSEDTKKDDTSAEENKDNKEDVILEKIKSDEKNGENESLEKQKPINYKYNLEDEIGVGGLKTKFRNNVEAIKTLKVIESENRLATEDEQRILAKYVGWGGMPQAFDMNAGGWNNEYAELKSLLTPEEYASARASTPNAHYTSPIVIESMYKAIESFGFKTGNILEPSMGVGNFFSKLPESMEGSKLYGVELGDISGRISKQLYQKANIKIQGFEQIDFPENFFDVAIGNVPFGDYKLYDLKYNKHNFLIHDYFFAKTLDKVRPGGIVAFVTSKGTLDKENSSVRKYLAERADLIGAIRLPNTAFKANANTDVTTDIIFLQKRERVSVNESNWLHVGLTEDKVPVNEYFIDNPEMLLGKMIFDQRMFGEGSKYTALVNEDENFNLEEALDKAVQNLNADIGSFKREENNVEDVISADPNVRNYTYTFVGDELYYRENAVMRKINESGKTLERIKGLHGIREITREIIDIQTRGCTETELKEKQVVLNARYDEFVKKYGYITSRANNTAFRDDNDYPLLCSLEYVNENNKVTKADMFTKQTIRPMEKITEVDTASEALTVSLNEKGKVDSSLMLQLYDSTPENIIEELKGQIFLNPEKYDKEDILVGWETQDEYLSGNVRQKLK